MAETPILFFFSFHKVVLQIQQVGVVPTCCLIYYNHLDGHFVSIYLLISRWLHKENLHRIW